MITDLDLNQMSQPKLHRILVVDDVPENLSLLSAMLGSQISPRNSKSEIKRGSGRTQPCGRESLSSVPG